MKEFKELEFSTKHVILFFLVFLIFEVGVFYFGFYLGKRHQRTKQEEIIAQRKDQLTNKAPQSLKKLPSPPVSQIDTSQEQTEKDRTKKMELPLKEKGKIPQKKEPKALPKKKNLYYVQVGAFKNKEYALSTLKKFKQKGYDASLINPSSEDGFPYYRVLIGGYEEKDQAVKIEHELEKAENDKYFIIRQ